MSRPVRDFFLTAAFLGLLYLSCLYFSGASFPNALTVTAIVSLQIASGAMVWSTVRRSRQSIFELLGVGAALGIIFSILIGLAFRPTSISAFSWVVLPILVALGAVILKALGKLEFSELEPPRKCEIIALTLGLVVGIFLLLEYWIATPLNPLGDAHYYVDIPFHEALGNGIAKYGPQDSVLNAGDSYRYHWFSHAWSGLTQLWAGNSPLMVGQTRALPLISLLVLVLVSIAWVRKLTNQVWAPAAATMLLSAGISIGFPGWANLLARSPSHVLGIALMLTTAYLVFEYVLEGLRARTLVVIALLSFATIGAKSSAALPLCIGILALTFYLIKDRTLVAKAFTVGVVVAISFIAGYFFAISGSDGGMTVALTSGLDRWGFSTKTYPILKALLSVALSLMALLPASLAAAYGVISSQRTIRVTSVIALAAGLAGLAAISTVSQVGQSQDYFLRAAFPLLVVAGVAGMASVEESKLVSSRRLMLAALCGILIQSLVVVIALRTKESDGIPPYVWPIGIWFAAFVSGLILAQRNTQPRGSRIKAVGALAAAFLLAAQFTTGITYAITSLATNDTSNQEPTVTSNELSAADWLANNAAGMRVATNRFCRDPEEDPTNCYSTIFTVATFSGQRVLVEGYTYAIGPNTKLDSNELNSITNGVKFSQDPTCSSFNFLKHRDIDFVWIDKRSTDRTNWEPYATIKYSNPTVSIVKLSDTACQTRN